MTNLSIWDANAKFWDNEMGDSSNFFHRDLVRPKTDELLNITEGDFILDIACGNGNYSQWLAEKGIQVVAIDFSPRMINLAVRRRSLFLELIDFRVCDVTNISELRSISYERKFTKAVANMAIMDISDIEPLFKEVYELLDCDGDFIFSMHHPCFTFPNDDYLSHYSFKGVAIDNQPELQFYFHRPLEYIFNLAFKCNFTVSGFSEVPFEGGNQPIIMIVRLSKSMR